MTTLSSISSSTMVSPATQLQSITATSQAPASSDLGGATAGSDGTRLSKMGDLMSKLQALETSDPDKAKAVLSKISADLKAKAKDTGDPKMAALADKFDQAAQSGDLSVLKPKGGGGHHHHHGGGGGGSASYAKAAGDPMEAVESIISSDLG